MHTFHHATPIGAPVIGKAEGIVSGERRSVSLKFGGTSRTGVYALNKQWPSEGTWVLFITANQGPNDDVTAVVELAADGQVAAVRVPTERRGSWKVPSDVSTAVSTAAAFSPCVMWVPPVSPPRPTPQMVAPTRSEGNGYGGEGGPDHR